MTIYMLKLHLQTFYFIPITQKMPNFELCDTLVAIQQYVDQVDHHPVLHTFKW
jgi:hypothetical protein